MFCSSSLVSTFRHSTLVRVDYLFAFYDMEVSLFENPDVAESVLEEDEAETAHSTNFFIFDDAHFLNAAEPCEVLLKVVSRDIVGQTHYEHFSFLLVKYLLVRGIFVHRSFDLDLVSGTYLLALDEMVADLENLEGGLLVAEGDETETSEFF